MSKNMITRVSLRLALVTMLAAVMLMICCCAAYADETDNIPEKVNGKYEIYNANQFVNWIKITNGTAVTQWDNDLQTNVTLADGDKGSACILKEDIEFTDDTLYYPGYFGQESNAFTGTLDGDGHTIKGVPPIVINGVNMGWQNGSTFFGYNKGTIKNVTFDLGTVTLNGGYAGVGVICGTNAGIISGVTVIGDVTYASAGRVALLCGMNKGADAMVLNCSTHGSLKASMYASGIMGSNITSQAGVIKNCYNMADITADRMAAGGILTEAWANTIKLENLYNGGKIMLGTSEITSNDLGGGASLYTNSYGRNDTFTAEMLGDAYAEDLEGDAAINNGRPVLKYQLDGQYPHVEGAEDIVIEKIKSMDATSLSALSSTKFEYYKPKTSDFALKVTSDMGAEAEVPITDLSMGSKGNILLSFNDIAYAKTADGKKLQTIEEQELTVKLLAGGKEAGELKYVLPKSHVWSDYASEPEKISKNDPRYGEKFSGYYKITKPEEMAWVAIQTQGDPAQYSNYFRDNCFLANDIVMNDTSDSNWKESDDLMIWDLPIGFAANDYRVFAGTFDGNGFAVKGVYMNYSATKNATRLNINSMGLFGRVDGTVKNLKVEDVYIDAGALNVMGGAGGIVGAGASWIENCSVSGEIIGGNYTAGILGGSNSNSKTIINCVNRANVTGAQPNYTAGIMAYAYNNSKIDNCYNTGKIAGSGILAYYWSSDFAAYLTNCYNAGKATYPITGSSNPVTIKDCYVVAGSGSVSGNIDVVSKEEAVDGTLLGYLGDEFVADDDQINSGYPVLKWESPLTEAQEKYPEELDFYVDIDEYGMNKDLIQDIIDEAKDKIANATSSAEADAAFNDAKAAIDLIPNDEQVKQAMADKLAELEEQIKEAERRYAFNACDIKLDKEKFVYTGEAFEPVVTVTDKDGKALVKDTDYEVKYEANTDPGFAKVIVTGKGEYSGSREVEFTITPAKISGLKLKKAKKAFTAKWTKDEKATGYQVSYGLKKNFKGAKTVKITKNTTVSKKVSKLKAKKKYFVRVRAYTTIDGKTVNGAWSAVKSVKTK